MNWIDGSSFGVSLAASGNGDRPTQPLRAPTRQPENTRMVTEEYPVRVIDSSTHAGRSQSPVVVMPGPASLAYVCRQARRRRTDMTTITTINRTRFQASSAPDTRPIVFVVDDDISVRESLESLIRGVRLAGRDVRVGAGVPRPSAGLGSELPGSGRGVCRTSAVWIFRSASPPIARTCPVIFITGCGDVSHERPGDEGRRHRVPDQAVPRRRADGRHPAGARAQPPRAGARREDEGASRELRVAHAARARSDGARGVRSF